MRIIREKGGDILVDDDVYEWASKKTWTIRDCGYTKYARGRMFGKVRYMHRIILGVSDPKDIVDHINGNGLDNRRENLRVCTVYENSMNMHSPHIAHHFVSSKSSKYTGVYWKKRHRKWEAHIKHLGKTVYLGLYDNEMDAAIAYNNASVKLRGGLAILNNID